MTEIIGTSGLTSILVRIEISDKVLKYVNIIGIKIICADKETDIISKI